MDIGGTVQQTPSSTINNKEKNIDSFIVFLIDRNAFLIKGDRFAFNWLWRIE